MERGGHAGGGGRSRFRREKVSREPRSEKSGKSGGLARLHRTHRFQTALPISRTAGRRREPACNLGLGFLPRFATRRFRNPMLSIATTAFLVRNGSSATAEVLSGFAHSFSRFHFASLSLSLLLEAIKDRVEVSCRNIFGLIPSG